MIDQITFVITMFVSTKDPNLSTVLKERPLWKHSPCPRWCYLTRMVYLQNIPKLPPKLRRHQKGGTSRTSGKFCWSKDQDIWTILINNQIIKRSILLKLTLMLKKNLCCHLSSMTGRLSQSLKLWNCQSQRPICHSSWGKDWRISSMSSPTSTTFFWTSASLWTTTWNHSLKPCPSFKRT